MSKSINFQNNNSTSKTLQYSGLGEISETNVLYAYLDKSHYPEVMQDHWHLVALSMSHRIQTVISQDDTNTAWRYFPEITIDGKTTKDFYKELGGINPDLKWENLFASESDIYGEDGSLDFKKINQKIKEKFKSQDLLVACSDSETRNTGKDTLGIYHPNVISAIPLNTKDHLEDLIPESLKAPNSFYFKSGKEASEKLNHTQFFEKQSSINGETYLVLSFSKNNSERKIIPFPIFLKPIDGGSGKGHKAINKKELLLYLKHHDYLKGLILEPWVNFEADLAFQGFISHDKVEIDDIFFQVSDDVGDFCGTLQSHKDILSPEIYSQLESWKKILVEEVLPKIQKQGYQGRVSLDGLFYKDPFYGNIFRIGDINARDMAGSLPLNAFLTRSEIKYFENPPVQGSFLVQSEISPQNNREKIKKIIDILNNSCEIFEFVGLTESQLFRDEKVSSMGTIIFSGNLKQLKNAQNLLKKIDIKIASLDEVIKTKQTIRDLLKNS